MEALGYLLHSLCVPGTVILLSGHLGSGKTAIARGIVRAFCGDPAMFVPSPTFLLNLTYQEDTAHDKVRIKTRSEDELCPRLQAVMGRICFSDVKKRCLIAAAPNIAKLQAFLRVMSVPQPSRTSAHPHISCVLLWPCVYLQDEPAPEQQQQQQQQGRSIHHMDPYRLGTTDKMAGLIDFEAAFLNDVCVIEWPSRMPDSVMQLPRRWGFLCWYKNPHRISCSTFAELCHACSSLVITRGCIGRVKVRRCTSCCPASCCESPVV
jgi:tRNA A37 threonylcarbamoyladenosine biosynthesis protein TsaE